MATRGAALARRLLAAAATAPAPRQDAIVVYKARSTRRFYSSNGGNATPPGAAGANGPTPPGANGGRVATPPGANGGNGATPPGAAGANGPTPPGANGGRGATPQGANGGNGATPTGAAGANLNVPLGTMVDGGDRTLKITMGDVAQGWTSTSGFRKYLYVAASALLGSCIGGATLLYSSLAERNCNQLIEGLEKIEKQAEEKRESAERKEKQRRDEWESRVQLMIIELATKLIKLEEKELKYRRTLTEAEQLLKSFGFADDAEVHCVVAKKFRELQIQMDFIRVELSKGPEDTPIAAELRDISASIESQMNTLKKRIIEAGMATETAIDNGVSSKNDEK